MKTTIRALLITLSVTMQACYGDLPDLDISETTAAEAPVTDWSDEEDLGFLDEGRTVDQTTHVNAVRQFFLLADEDGVAPGFNLDGIISPDGDVASCGHGDFTDPNGDGGVDNQFAAVWSAAEPLIGEAVVALLLDGVNEGRMLVLMELSGVDSLIDDDDVTLTVLRSQDQPIVSMAGYLVPDQTFSLDPEFPLYVHERATITDGRLFAGPFDFAMPIMAFNADFVLPMRNGYVDAIIHEDGHMEGIFGGELDVEDTIEKFLNTNASQEAMLIAPIVRDLADLNKNSDGVCSHMSGALRFEGTNAFIVTETGAPEAPVLRPTD